MKTSTLLYALLIGVILIPASIITALILNVYKDDLLAQTTNRTLQTLRAVTYSQEQEIHRVVSYSAAVSMDQEVLTVATKLHDAAADDRHSYTNNLHTYLNKYSASMSGHVLAINFHYKDGTVYSYLKEPMRSERVIRASEWYRLAVEEPDRILFAGMQHGMIFNANDDKSIVTAIAPSMMQGMHEIEVISFVFSREGFQKVLRQHPDTQSSQFALLSKDGSIIGTSGPFLTDVEHDLADKLFSQREGVFTQKVEGRNMLITFTNVEGADWRVMHELPVKKLTSNYDRIYRFVLIATAIIIIVSLCIALYFVNRLVRPIQMLVVKMSRVVQGNLNAKIEETGTRELVAAGQTFNHMMDEIKRLIIEREVVEKEKRTAEFTALQSQINPHFLINTLNSIRLMAIISKADNIKKMTHALIQLLHSSFNRGGTMTSIADEVQNLKQYLFIMETRYGNKFEVEWEVDETAKNAYILKMLLQPIIENSIFHGMSGTYGGGIIRILIVRQLQSLHITIRDNGAGMTQQAMIELLEEKESAAFSGMGISNVHKRIQLHYGEPYGIMIKSNSSGGVTIDVHVPLHLHGDEEE
ncbi:sensor histidine kinase [Paenibacillus chungangensis]|uniref:histidine kinase n=1 Tax=Paenibacillus chungangensis TaxID=696535 RepID=A0ABW3HTG3_9BACL